MSSVPESSKNIPPIGLLAEAGFVEGDFLPLYTFSPNANASVGTTSTTYNSDPTISRADVIWGDLFPSGVESQVLGIATLVPGAGETVDVRIQNHADGETIAEETGFTGTTGVTLGPVSYTPTTTASRIDIYTEWRTSPGTNSSDLWTPQIVLGVKV